MSVAIISAENFLGPMDTTMSSFLVCSSLQSYTKSPCKGHSVLLSWDSLDMNLSQERAYHSVLYLEACNFPTSPTFTRKNLLVPYEQNLQNKLLKYGS